MPYKKPGWSGGQWRGKSKWIKFNPRYTKSKSGKWFRATSASAAGPTWERLFKDR